MAKKKKRQKTKSVEIPREMVDRIRDHWREFREKYGHEPPKDGPIFYDLSASMPTPLNANTLLEALVDAAAKSGLDPAKVYAIRKTGRIISADKAHLLSRAERKEWLDAVDEYRAIQTALKRDSN